MYFKRAALAIALCGLVLSAAATFPGCRAQEKYPSKPITIVTSLAAGSILDLYCREASRLVEKVLNVTLPVENRTGGSGSVALTHVKSQPADGYTVVGGETGLMYTVVKADSPVKLGDFVGIMNHVSQPAALIVRDDGRFNTLQDLIQYAKSGKNKLKAGGTGAANFYSHVFYDFSKAAGIETAWVGFDGGNQALAALLGEHIDAVSMGAPAAVPHIKAGKLKALAVAWDKRHSLIPDTPTYQEQGFNLVRARWMGILASVNNGLKFSKNNGLKFIR